MSQPTRHSIEWSAAGLRRAALEAGVTLPVDYSQALATDGLQREPSLAVSRLGDGVVIHTQPNSTRRLPTLLGYADARGQWYRNGRRHHPAAQPDAPTATTEAVPL